MWHKLEDAALNVAEAAHDRRDVGNFIESGPRLKLIWNKANAEDKEDTSLWYHMTILLASKMHNGANDIGCNIVKYDLNYF